MLRQQMGSLRSLQNECIVFVPPGACRESAGWFEGVVWTGVPKVSALGLPPSTQLPRPYKCLKKP